MCDTYGLPYPQGKDFGCLVGTNPPQDTGRARGAGRGRRSKTKTAEEACDEWSDDSPTLIC